MALPIGRAIDVLGAANEQLGLWRYRARERLGGRPPITIQPYRGFGTQESLYVKGRVLEARELRPAGATDSALANLVSMAKRFVSREIPYARLLASFQGARQEVTANSEGYFELSIRPDAPLDHRRLWQEVGLELLEPRRPGYASVRAIGHVFVPPPTAAYGVISDVDDTVVATDATSILRMLRTVMLSNARTRLPLTGVAAFYRALLGGAGGNALNPLFYVSSSPWNLYDLLSEFFQIHDIALGPILFLRDWGIAPASLPFRRRSHKLAAIATLLDTYGSLPFILVGDSGEQDPEIYLEVVEQHPGRIMAIYLRNVERRPGRVQAIEALATKVVQAGSTLILADHTAAFTKHAIDQGWVPASALAQVLAEQRSEASLPDPTAPIIGPKKTAPTVIVRGNE